MKVQNCTNLCSKCQKNSCAVSHFFSIFTARIRDTIISTKMICSLSFYQTVITENFNVELFWTSASNPTQAQNRALVAASSRVSNDSAEIVKVKYTDMMRFLTACIPQKKFT